MDTKKLRQKILDLAIRGKLVPQDPNDEPASVLLERIRAEKERLIKEGKIKRSKKSAKSSDTPHYENVPFEVPESWEWVKLEDYLLLLSGQDFPPQKYNSEHKGIPYIIGASNIENEKLFVNRWTEEPSVISILNDVLVVCKGAGVGKIAMNDVGNVHIARQIQAIRDETNIINSKYIKLCIASNISGIIANANGLIPGLKRELLLSLIIPVAPIEEQTRIVTAVEQCFTLIDTLEKETDDLSARIRQVKSSILDLAIHGKLVPQEPSDKPAIELLKRINPKFTPCDNAHYENVPDSWIKVPLGDICTLNEGEPITDKEYFYIDVKGLRTGNYASKQSGKYVTAGTTLILVDGENSGEVFYTPVEGYQGSTMKVLNIDSNMNTQYVLYFVNLHQRALRENKVGSAIPHLNKKMFRELIIPIPPIGEQERIVEAILQYYRLLDNISANL